MWPAISVVLELAVIIGIFGRALVLTPVGYAVAFWDHHLSLVDLIDRIRRGITLAQYGRHDRGARRARDLRHRHHLRGSRTRKSVTSQGPGETVTLGNYAFRSTRSRTSKA